MQDLILLLKIFLKWTKVLENSNTVCKSTKTITFQLKTKLPQACSTIMNAACYMLDH